MGSKNKTNRGSDNNSSIKNRLPQPCDSVPPAITSSPQS